MSKQSAINVGLVLLTVTSGCVDAISFLALGQVFTAAMTGNTVLFGLALAHAEGLHAINYAMALGGFILGAAVCALLMRRAAAQSGWSRAVSGTLFVELAALLAFASLSSAAGGHPQGTVLDVLIAMLAMAMGVQGAAARRIGVTGVTTTVITSTLTGLVESVVWNLSGPSRNKQSREPSPAESNAIPKGPAKTSLKAVAMWIGVIVAYGVGAGACGVCIQRWHLHAIWLPIFIVCVVIVTAFAFVHPRVTEGSTRHPAMDNSSTGR